MANYSVCGIDCDICKFRMNCKGCEAIKLKEWASADNPERIDNLRNLV